jgi:hypothetical protein
MSTVINDGMNEFGALEKGCTRGNLKYSEKKVNVYLPSLMMKVSNNLYVLGDTYTCHT